MSLQRFDDVCLQLSIDTSDTIHVRIYLACEAPRKKPFPNIKQTSGVNATEVRILKTKKNNRF